MSRGNIDFPQDFRFPNKSDFAFSFDPHLGPATEGFVRTVDDPRGASNFYLMTVGVTLRPLLHCKARFSLPGLTVTLHDMLVNVDYGLHLSHAEVARIIVHYALKPIILTDQKKRALLHPSSFDLIPPAGADILVGTEDGC